MRWRARCSRSTSEPSGRHLQLPARIEAANPDWERPSSQANPNRRGECPDRPSIDWAHRRRGFFHLSPRWPTPARGGPEPPSRCEVRQLGTKVGKRLAQLAQSGMQRRRIGGGVKAAPGGGVRSRTGAIRLRAVCWDRPPYSAHPCAGGTRTATQVQCRAAAVPAEPGPAPGFDAGRGRPDRSWCPA